MSGKLVNVFGAVNLETTQVTNQELLLEILVQLKILNEHMSRMRGDEVDVDDLEDTEYTI